MHSWGYVREEGRYHSVVVNRWCYKSSPCFSLEWMAIWGSTFANTQTLASGQQAGLANTPEKTSGQEAPNALKEPASALSTQH